MMARPMTLTIDNFELKDHESTLYRLSAMMGENGILLGFTNDVWDISAVRYVLWLQRQRYKLSTFGINTALIVPNQCYELNGFFKSIPRDIQFPMLADPQEIVYRQFTMEKSGYLLLDAEGQELERWYLKENASLSVKSVLTRLR